MRRRTLFLLVLAMVGACSDPRSDVTTTADTTPPSSTSPETTVVSSGPIRGALPDGTIYDIAFPVAHNEEIREIHAELVMDLDGREVPVAVEFRLEETHEPESGAIFEAGDWLVEVKIPERMGEPARETIVDAIAVSTEVEMPVLTLQPPMDWAEPPHIEYDSFSVHTGCPEDAVACNATHSVSVVPHRDVTLEGDITVQSYALRPASDPNYLEHGPLRARWYPDVIWTGQEMIVWGGSPDPGPPRLIDGAAYDPEADRWRSMSAPPLETERQTRAFWAGSRLVVVSDEVTLAWDPNRDRWSIIGNGLEPPLDPGMGIDLGSDLAVWNARGIFRLHDRVWEQLPDPGVGEPGLDDSVLRAYDSQLLAIGHENCERLITRWDDGAWSQRERIPLTASGPACGRPNQSAVVDDGIVLWDDTSGAVVTYDPSSETSVNGAPFPLPGMERPSGPLPLDDGFLVTADLKGAIYDTDDDDWTEVDLPGLGTDVNMVWSGEEILMWDKCCYGPDDIDAWRWTPPTD